MMFLVVDIWKMYKDGVLLQLLHSKLWDLLKEVNFRNKSRMDLNCSRTFADQIRILERLWENC